MKIERMRVFMSRDKDRPRVIVAIDTDDGITGWGECYNHGPDKALPPLLDYLYTFIEGQDPRRIEYLILYLLQQTRFPPGALGLAAISAIDHCLWDISAKALGVPVYMLLGGMVRERIALSRSITFGAPEQMAEAARGFAAEGFGTVKVKVGQSFDIDVAAVAAVRAAVGDKVKVRVDANMAWRSAKEAAQIIRAMAPSRPELIEQPLKPRELDALAELRLLTDVPIMADESVWNPRDALEVIRRKAVDIVNVYVCEAGGLMAATRIFQMCETAGLPCMIGSMPELGLGTAAQIHLGTAMTNLGLDSDACGVVYQQADLLKTPLRIEKGYAYPPSGPGLGVEIDLDAVEKYRIAD